MPALDTHVLVRYLVQDDPAQFAAAKRLIGRCLDEDLSLFVPVTVVLELEWVLRSNFGFAKGDVLRGALEFVLGIRADPGIGTCSRGRAPTVS